MTTEHKQLKVRVKAAGADGEPTGQVEAVFSTFNVVDHDGDVTRPGAFENGAKVLISAYNHQSWAGSLPVGQGEIAADDTQAVMKGQFWLDTTGGADTFKVVERAGDLQEWSYGYDVKEASFGQFGDPEQDVRFLTALGVTEVSPVIKGAGIDTRTLVAKGYGLTFADEALMVSSAIEALVKRATDLRDLRSGDGRKLGTRAIERLRSVGEGIEELRKAIADLTIDPEEAVEASRLLARMHLADVARAHRVT